MDRNLQSARFWWIVVFISLSTLAESKYLSSPASRLTNMYTPSWAYARPAIQPEVSAVKQRQSAQLGVRPRSVVVKCHPDSMEVVVQADMFNMGLQVDGRHLRLGSDSAGEGVACGALPSGEAEFTLKAQLMSCGTKLSSTREKIIYSNVLVYSSEPSSGGFIRLDGATIPIECHYERRYAVNGVSLRPTWVPFVSRASAEDLIDFDMRLMTDDWQLERGSFTYFLGDPIHFEVSAVIENHIPLRVYVDHCVATATPDSEAALRYDFIEHHGCLADAYLTNSSSYFLPRVEENKLRFQLDAFKFYHDPSNQVYITCHVKAVPTTLTVSSRNRACSLVEKRWRSADGSDQACRSCDISYRLDEPPSTEPLQTTLSTKGWSALTSQDSLVEEKPDQHSATYIRYRPGMHPSQHDKAHQSSAKLKRGTDYRAEQTVQLGPLVVHASNRFQNSALTTERHLRRTD
ncbi:zona pellucida sperm-binding protein 3-like [Mastacembelus armatus]|uniref:Zona pellucida sperm-binding protein 3 n=1 Tax=Mastacembelus armatus TaxID=205130 RepID=A0A3Q3S4T8_9TELE|nr:zona pellucida sperm-binding protein 3-like [Mastacembelus armatus]